jgi:hypothetical protein
LRGKGRFRRPDGGAAADAGEQNWSVERYSGERAAAEVMQHEKVGVA